ncbi:MAG: flagellar type III secretion system pore protein FliP [Lentisphaeraceae bacterium]|nr:flagellar type III secretion system pore protein FliP [Lentisphaeraceae bacterium]
MKTKKIFLFSILAFSLFSATAFGQAEVTDNSIGVNLSLEGSSFSKAVNILLLMTMLSLVPSFIMMMTSFTRIVIVLNFLKQAMGTQSAPSAKVVSALALFLSIFIMYPVYDSVYNEAVIPFSNNQIKEEEAINIGVKHIKAFMLRQTRESDLLMFMDLAKQDPVDSPEDLSMRIIIPSFLISELKTAFQMGFLIYLPFLVIDLVIATILMAMGMMMLPPVMISLPFKLLLFILVDGWGLLIYNLVGSFG